MQTGPIFMMSRSFTDVSMTVNRGSHNTPGSPATGFAVLIFSVCPSARMDSIPDQFFASADLESVRSKEDFTASAVTL